MTIYRVWRNRMIFLAVAVALITPAAFAYNHYSGNQAVLADISISALLPEAKETLKLIKQGGPFPYPRDGIVFSNFEKRLPKRQRGYYHEYTVKTPGVRSRGARRIVCGQPVECYYSDDHYETFKRIRE